MYFEQKLERIRIGNSDYPIKMDMFVLEKIQKIYGNINTFELLVKGISENIDEEGSKKYSFVEPSIEAINMVLPEMVYEGCDIEGVAIDLSEKDIVRNVRCSYMELQQIIIKEFNKCFETEKKEKPNNRQTKKNQSR